jgi:hypothetical protein
MVSQSDFTGNVIIQAADREEALAKGRICESVIHPETIDF